MIAHFISLNCTSCGGALEVYDDMERFACGYCGTNTAVQRKDGTTVLKEVSAVSRGSFSAQTTRLISFV